MDLSVLPDHRVKLKECEKRDKHPDLTWELKISLEHEVENDSNSNLCAWNNTQRLPKRTGGLGNKRTSGGHPDTQYYDRLEYWEVSWTIEEICCHSNSNEKPPANVGMIISQWIIIVIIIIIIIPI